MPSVHAMNSAYHVSDLMFETITHSAKETYRLGQSIGESTKPGMVLALIGDLGSGKTVLAKGLARGLDVPEKYCITSPTYTLINVYPGRTSFFHVDLYRIAGHADIEEIGLFDILHENGTVVIEWADRLQAGVLSEYLKVSFAILDDESRRISVEAYGHREENLLKELTNMRK